MESVSERHHSSTLQLYMKVILCRLGVKVEQLITEQGCEPNCEPYAVDFVAVGDPYELVDGGRDIRRVCTYGTNRKFTE
jgi:hypothetical protein